MLAPCGPWRCAMGQSPDGWRVLYFTSSDQSDEDNLAQGRKNAEHLRIDPDTVRVVYVFKATKEDKAVCDNWMKLTLARMEDGRIA